MPDEFGVVLLDELMDFLGLAPLQLVECPGLGLAPHKGDPVAYLFGGAALIGQQPCVVPTGQGFPILALTLYFLGRLPALALDDPLLLVQQPLLKFGASLRLACRERLFALHAPTLARYGLCFAAFLHGSRYASATVCPAPPFRLRNRGLPHTLR
ncbi:hypothetical protein [Mycobacterium sp. NPDC050853]|uniref:hypothetical protein n=1 Tax=Mycobacterium sp. NPDC050853 TaxID=3155160 RepID=UPI0033D0E20A